MLAGVHWARRLRPGEDHADATVRQITDLLHDLAATGKWRAGDPPPLVMLDAGYPATGISCALTGQPVQVMARLRSDRVFYADPGRRAPGQRGAPRRHGQASLLIDDLRRPWHKKPGPGQILSPYRVRLGFRRPRAHRGTPARGRRKAPGPAGAAPGIEEPAQGPATDLP